ncbi:MAG: hypothetical protein PHR35_16515 [Kiritimatiellae bacterium]|nr:hypothetical protein [Kiritimatiellia bacterium]
MDLIAQEKQDLKYLAVVVALVVLASMLGTQESYPPSAFTAVWNLVGLLLNVPIFVMAVRITKRGTPAVRVLGVLVLLLVGVACVQTVKWVFQLR